MSEKDKIKIITIEKDGKVVRWFTQEAYDKFKAYENAMIDVEINILKRRGEGKPPTR